MHAVATLAPNGERIRVVTTTANTDEFETMLAASRRVLGGQFREENGLKFWHYPATVDTCHALRRAFGDHLRITYRLGRWYRGINAGAQEHALLAKKTDATLDHVDPAFAGWLRGYQRVGARWIAEAYRDAGLVADTPGVGKTPELLAGLIEGNIQGPVLVVCPKNAVRLTWGAELARHLPDVPVYLCYGKRERRDKVIAQFMADVKARPRELRVVVVVAEMLRVELGPRCLIKESGKPVSGMCPRTAAHTRNHVAELEPNKKKWVPVGFSYSALFDKSALGGGWSAVVLDESHKLLGSLTIAKGNLMGKGLKLLPYRLSARRYALSGTPFGKGGRVQGMFGTLHWMWPDEYPSYWKWAAEHFVVEEKQINRAGATAKEVRGLKGLAAGASPEQEAQAMEDFLRTLGPRILRRTTEETNKDMPPKAYIEVVCPMTRAQAKQYRALADYAETPTPNGVVAANGALALLTRERQVANGQITMGPHKVQFTGESGKLDRLEEALDARGILDRGPGTKLIIASTFNEFLDVVQARLRALHVPLFRLDGSTTDNQRDMMVNSWQANTFFGAPRWTEPLGCAGTRPRVFLVNSAAAGISINLDAADEMHILDEQWNPEEMEQLEGRIYRVSRNHKTRFYYYRTEGTIDYARAHSVEMKRRAQHAVLDGARGMAYLREMMIDSFADTEVDD